MKVWYVRISSVFQNELRQVEAAKAYGAEKLFIDKCSGKNADRPQLKEMLSFVREGDVLYVESISRLARNVRDLLNIIDELQSKKVSFVSIKENIDTSTSTGKFMLTVFAALSEMELNTIHDRQREGIELAKQKGIYKGRAPMKIDIEKFNRMCEEWRASKRTATSIQKEFGITGTTFYRWAKQQGFALSK